MQQSTKPDLGMMTSCLVIPKNVVLHYSTYNWEIKSFAQQQKTFWVSILIEADTVTVTFRRVTVFSVIVLSVYNRVMHFYQERV